MKQLTTKIEINASATTVWNVLTDFDEYPQWNPFIRFASGEVKKGARLEVQLQRPGGNIMTFRPTVLVAEPEREFRWLGQLLLSGIFNGEHYFQIEPLGSDRIRFIHGEIFSGILVPFLAKSLDTKTKIGFEKMNQALKARAEI
ncbi:SRPBCC domain-containing protein [Gloeocapsopsis crepidinum LEGE 06123]|uniref:SRPBCC domain-containing protein n=1 Tax=Gloeocapsopsis crepidinum LEGE 06123 TaxID=588587 RepID=A0ABR9USF8_9CHRO|nr:SRPBCC domain-containing protein [Gloeocapsopsis crepidinum]MBE9191209.1 SRPBCC domain-containing protein [Gloeocapsopsis crepidinum LEGE 06123]